MQNRWLGRLLVTLALLTVIAGALWQFLDAKTRKPAEAQSQIAKSDFRYHYTPPVISSSAKEVETEPERDAAGLPKIPREKVESWLAKNHRSAPSLVWGVRARTLQKEVETEPERDAAGLPKIPREKVESWLAKHHRSATSLLAAFRALNDTNYLNEAATNFPNDPHVELAVLARDEFPADRRKWLDLLKASSPSNSLANYFSAQDYFKNGNTDAAMQELLAASGKSQFDNHAIEVQLDTEELYLDSGKSPTEAATYAMSAMAEEDLPELATIKQTDRGIADLMQQKIAAGDANSAASLAQMGMIIANKLNSGDSGKYLINQLVGIAAVAIALQHLDQNTACDFLGGQTPR